MALATVEHGATKAEGMRFPWTDSDKIEHARANYVSQESDPNDVSRTRGGHPSVTSGHAPYCMPAGHFPPNAFGLLDMAGNVWQQCWDWYGIYPSGVTDPRGVESGWFRVQRGGSGDYYGQGCRVSFRYYGMPDANSWHVGFRTVRCDGAKAAGE